jgi:molecular chaperone DnaK (HSP70)
VKDVSSDSVDTSVVDGSFSVIVPKWIEIPCEKRRKYDTAFDSQTEIRIDVYEGEHFCDQGTAATSSWQSKDLRRFENISKRDPEDADHGQTKQEKPDHRA